jgi:hypothetical protein
VWIFWRVLDLCYHYDCDYLPKTNLLVEFPDMGQNIHR